MLNNGIDKTAYYIYNSAYYEKITTYWEQRMFNGAGTVRDKRNEPQVRMEG